MSVEMGFETKMTAITPLEGVITHMLEKIHAIALNPVPQRLLEIQQDCVQRNEDLREFLKELEKNPLGFSRGEIESLKKHALELSKKLDVIALCLDIIYQSPEIVLEMVGLYSKQRVTLQDEIVDEFSKIENIEVRDNFLKNSLEIKEYLKGFPQKSIGETIGLINKYYTETPEEDLSYKGILRFFLGHHASWIPTEIFRFVFEKAKDKMLSPESDVKLEAIRLKEIEKKVTAFELQIVPHEEKRVRLNEIQSLKNELNAMQENPEKISELQTRLEKLSDRLISKPKDFGFFGAKHLQPSPQ